MILRQYLESEGFLVDTADDGVSALDMMEKNRYQLVLQDIVMPRMDGWDVIRRVRAMDHGDRLPVIAVTSLSDPESMRRGMEAGFDDWETKLDKERLIGKIRSHLHMLPEGDVK